MRMIIYIARNFLAIAFLFLFFQSGFTQEEKEPKLQVSGYIKYLTSYNVTTLKTPFLSYDTTLADNFIHNRLNLKYFATPKLTFSLEARNRIFYGERVRATPGFADQIDQYNGLADLSVRWLETESAFIHSIIDRAYIDYTSGKWNVRVGRQRINWGINLVWNPNDLFNALNFLDFDYEERPGSDAIRVQYYPGALSTAEIAFAPADSIEQSVGAALYKFNVKGYDVQVLAGYYRGDLALGTGWAGNIGGMGLKGEATFFTPLEPSSDTVNSLGISATGDYLFGNGLYLSGAFLYNSQGKNSDIASALTNLNSTSNISSKNLFPAEWAFVTSLSGNINPLLAVNGTVIYSPGNHLTAIMPTVTYSIKENWDIDLVGQTFLMELFDSYQHLSTSVFLRLKWSY